MWKRNKKNEDNEEADKGLSELFKLVSYLGPYRLCFYSALICLFVTALLSLAFPYLMGELIGGSMGGADGIADPKNVKEKINSVALILVTVLAVQAFIAYWRVRWFAFAGESALADIRKDAYGKLVKLPMSYFSERRVGELCSRISADLSLIRDTLILTVPQIIRQAVMLVGGISFIAWASPKLTMVMLLCIPIVVILMGIFGRGIRVQTREAQDELAASNVIVEESLHGIASVKAFTNESHEELRYSESIKGFVNLTLSASKARALFVSFIIFALFGVITFVIWYGAGMLDRGEINATKFTQFVLFSIFVGAALGSFPDILSQLHKAVGATVRVREIINERPEEEGDDCEQLSRLRGEVRFIDVSFSYPSRKEVAVLKEINLSVNAGERVAIVGASGAGKSTLFQLLMRFYDPSSGELQFDGQNAANYSLRELRNQMAIVPQEVLLFGGSIRDNIAYGCPEAEDSHIIAAAEKANAHEFIQSFPESYETIVGDRGVKLSGGQRQRIAIARAILADPAILLLDEATSSLDSESEGLVNEALETLMSERTSIIIAHRLATVRGADRILVLRDGRFIESGTHEELSCKDGGVYKMLSELQFN